jgi:hypothetical protein
VSTKRHLFQAESPSSIVRPRLQAPSDKHMVLMEMYLASQHALCAETPGKSYLQRAQQEILDSKNIARHRAYIKKQHRPASSPTRPRETHGRASSGLHTQEDSLDSERHH